MGTTIGIPWTDGVLEVELPATWKVLGTLLPRESSTEESPPAACAGALARPYETAPLSGRDLSRSRIIIVADDHSRPTPVKSFLPAVLDELKKGGARDGNISFLLANGVHRQSTEQEAAEKIGSNCASRYSWRCHDAYDRAGLTDLGSTSRGTKVSINSSLMNADLIVCLGAIEPHLLLGFGGGLKMIVPGCAGAETIGRNHLQGVDADRFNQVGADGDDSVMRLDLEEAAGRMGKEIFIVNAVMNAQGSPARFFCGHPIAAHRAGVAFIRGLVEMQVPEQADVIIANSHPLNADLRQSIKCVGNSLFAAKPGGVMMGFVRCDNGLGEIPVPARTLPYPLLRTLVRAMGRKRILPFVQKVRKNDPVEEIFVGHFGMQMLRRNHLALYSERLPVETGKKIGMARTFDNLGTVIEWTRKRVPRNATVWVFPYGGATFTTR